MISKVMPIDASYESSGIIKAQSHAHPRDPLPKAGRPTSYHLQGPDPKPKKRPDPSSHANNGPIPARGPPKRSTQDLESFSLKQYPSLVHHGPPHCILELLRCVTTKTPLLRKTPKPSSKRTRVN